jgi:hypothetical protein
VHPVRIKRESKTPKTTTLPDGRLRDGGLRDKRVMVENLLKRRRIQDPVSSQFYGTPNNFPTVKKKILINRKQCRFSVLELQRWGVKTAARGSRNLRVVTTKASARRALR